jgi:PKHD-type hydroxylase
MALRIPNVLNQAQLAVVQSALAAQDAPWVDGRVTAGHQGVRVKNNQQIDESSETARSLGQVILTALERNPLFVSAALPNRVYPPMFNRYVSGMYFGSHVDGAIRRIPGSHQKLRADLSATLFLTAPDTYQGGELVIETQSDEQSFKLGAGDLLVYPTTSQHHVKPVTDGMRVACFFWIQSLVRDEAQRAQLLLLDRTIQRLTEAGADADSLVALASVYHNLLRQWSEL